MFDSWIPFFRIPADFSIDSAAAVGGRGPGIPRTVPTLRLVLLLFPCTFSELALTNPQTGKPFEWAQLETDANSGSVQLLGSVQLQCPQSLQERE